jgi:DNA polymerase elongation subunit (family B)
MKQSILVLDIETDGKSSDTANLKYFGAYSYLNEEYYCLDYTRKEEIRMLIKKHKYVVGFNNKNFDQPIINRFFADDVFKYKIVLDLFEMLAPRGSQEYNKGNKNMLTNMGYSFKNYKLKTIVANLKLDSENKGDIDYDIFKKDRWTEEEIKEIEKYVKQDIVITKKLLEWYDSQFEPLKHFLNSEDQRKLKHLRSSLPSLAYHIICNKAGLPVEWDDQKPENKKSYSGGHHIEPRWDLVKGNIIEIDFASAYPHAMMMCNLYSPSKTGWNGNGYFKVDGVYNNNKRGKIELALNEILIERLNAKKNEEKAKNLSYKLIINSAYGITGNYKFKSLYNPVTAGDCTSIVRTLMKKLAKTIEENGFSCLYGFTDSIFVKVPESSNKEELMMVVDHFIKEVKSNVPFPLDTFKLDVEEEIKLIWFVSKNNYLFLTNNNEIKYTSTILNKNTPKSVMKVFEDYMKPKIIKTIDINFTEKELTEEIKKLLLENLEYAAEEHSVNNKEDYKFKSSIQYQISHKYGEGKHLLISNKKGVGVGKSKSYCSIEDFKTNKLTIEDIDIDKLMKSLDPFTKIKKESDQQ